MREEKGTNKYRIKGQSVMEKRLSMGYTQEKLGELTGFSRTTIQNIEGNVISGTVNQLMRLVKALECESDELIEEEKSNE